MTRLAQPFPSTVMRLMSSIVRVLASAAVMAGCARASTSATLAPERGSYDVVIENGRVVDGTGTPWTYGDVGIRGDRIVAVTPPGMLRTASAKQRVDARRHVVAPGFIDIQAHSWTRCCGATAAC